MNVSEFRYQHPEYSDISDVDLTRKLHTKFYSDIPIDNFAKQFGVSLVSPATAEISYPEGRKPFIKGVEHGLGRMGLGMVKGLAGIAKTGVELTGPMRERFWTSIGLQKPQYQQRVDQFLKDWSTETSKAIDWYYENYPEEAKRHPPGFEATLAAHVTQPEVLIQGIIETIPLILQGTVGTIVGGPVGGILAMTPMLSGMTYIDARKEGTAPLLAFAQALITGLGEAAIEQWTLGRKLGLAKNFRKMVAKGFPKVLWEGTKTFFRGMAEEGSQEFWRNFWNWTFTDRSQAWFENVGEAMAAGGPLELAMGGAFAATSYVGKSVPTKEKVHRLEQFHKIVEQNTELTEQHKQEIKQELDIQERYIGDIEFTMQSEIRERFPDMINSQTSLERVGNQIKEHLGIEEDIKWVWNKRKTTRLRGKFRTSDNRLTIFGPIFQEYENPPQQIKNTIVHELGHLIKPAYYITGRRIAHHPEFKKWIAENKQELYEVRMEVGAVDPIYREEAVGPVREPPIPEKKITRKKALALGHAIPETFGWNEKQRRDFMEIATGKRSMKDMSLEEMRFYVDALKSELGITDIEAVDNTEELIRDLQRKKITKVAPYKKTTRTKMYQMKHIFKKNLITFGYGLARMERFFDSLGKSFTEHIWLPVKNARGVAAAQENRRATEFLSYLENQNIDTAIWVGKAQDILNTDLSLTASQRIGVYILEKNDDGQRYLRKGNKFSDTDIKAVQELMSPEEIKIGEWLLEQYESQWDLLVQSASQAGIDLAELKKVFSYSPILRTDIELERQENFLAGLIDPFRQESFSPEKGMLEKRKEYAIGEIELDALVGYLHNIHRVEQFIAMAPTAKKVQTILNNRTFKQELNKRTYNQGSKLINSWMADTIRGYSTSSATQLAKTVQILRRNAIVYAIGYNIPSALRQTLSLQNAIAVDPLMLKYIPLNMKQAVQNYEVLRDFVYERSSTVKYRNYERDLRRAYKKSDLQKILKGKVPWSKRATSWIRWMDKHTTVVAWKSLFDVGMEKFKGNEQKAVGFADKYIGRTQPMANVEDLPQFFRGGPLEKLLTTFQNQINNNGNFYYYDILEAKRKDAISWTTVGYRTMFSYVLPAILFGMIGRARPPRNWEELGIDLATYPVAPLVVIGRWIDRILRGWGQSGTVVEIGGEAVVGFGRAAIEGDIEKMIKNAAKTIGAFTGAPTAQMIRTTEGALDLLAGTTKDPRRLIYSKWTLEQGKPPKKKVSIYD